MVLLSPLVLFLQQMAPSVCREHSRSIRQASPIPAEGGIYDVIGRVTYDVNGETAIMLRRYDNVRAKVMTLENGIRSY